MRCEPTNHELAAIGPMLPDEPQRVLPVPGCQLAAARRWWCGRSARAARRRTPSTNLMGSSLLPR